LNLTPRKRFQQTPDAKKHFDLTASESFQKTIDAAVLQHVMQVALKGSTYDPQIAMAEYHRILGAIEFADLLLKFADPEKPLERKDTLNLNHKV